jgi:hypothetical protein
MSKPISIKKDEETGEFYLDFEELKDMFENPDSVDSYSIETREDDSIVLEFFDKDGNRVVPSKL